MLPLLALMYVVFPIDLIPFNPIDDVALLILVVKLFLQLAPDDALNSNPGRDTETRDEDDAIDTTWRVVKDE